MGFREDLERLGNQASAAKLSWDSSIDRAASLAEAASHSIRKTIAETTEFLASRRIRLPYPDHWQYPTPPTQHWVLPNMWIPCIDSRFYAWVQYGQPSGVVEIPYHPSAIVPIASSGIDQFLNYANLSTLPKTMRFAVDEFGKPYMARYITYDGIEKYQINEFEPEMLRVIELLLETQ